MVRALNIRSEKLRAAYLSGLNKLSSDHIFSPGNGTGTVTQRSALLMTLFRFFLQRNGIQSPQNNSFCFPKGRTSFVAWKD
jgi:hypothetical protein